VFLGASNTYFSFLLAGVVKEFWWATTAVVLCVDFLGGLVKIASALRQRAYDFKLFRYLLETPAIQYYTYYLLLYGRVRHLALGAWWERSLYLYTYAGYVRMLRSLFSCRKLGALWHIGLEQLPMAYVLTVTYSLHLVCNKFRELRYFKLYQLFFWFQNKTSRGLCAWVGKPCHGQRTHTNARSAFYTDRILKIYVLQINMLYKLSLRAHRRGWGEAELKKLQINKRLQKIATKVRKKQAKPHKLGVSKKNKKGVWD